MENGLIKSTTMRLVEHVFEDRLERLLPSWYEEDLSPPEMAERIRSRGINVTPQTIRNWRRLLQGRHTILFPGDEVIRSESQP